MDKGLVEFYGGGVNVADFHALISRETLPNGIQRISVKEFGSEIELWGFWYNPHKKADPVEIEKPCDSPPKHTGGKKPYVMLMLGELRKLKDGKIPNLPELTGCLVCLGDNVEWGTGRLVRGRGKNKKPMQYADIHKILGYSDWKLNKMLALMKEHNLLTHTGEGYFVSSRLIKKGKTGGSNAKETDSDQR